MRHVCLHIYRQKFNRDLAFANLVRIKGPNIDEENVADPVTPLVEQKTAPDSPLVEQVTAPPQVVCSQADLERMKQRVKNLRSYVLGYDRSMKENARRYKSQLIKLIEKMT